MFKASLKQNAKSKWVLFLDMSTPAGFAVIYILQILLFYTIKPKPFLHLSQFQYLACFFCSQIIFFLVFERSLNKLSGDIRSGQLDVILLQPVDLFFFKYFRHMHPQIPFILGYSLVGLLLVLPHTSIGLWLAFKLGIFTLICALIRNNIIAAYSALQFWSRDGFGLGSLFRLLEDTVSNRPPEVFPTLARFSFSYIIPVILVQSFIFDLIRGRDNWLFWLATACWFGVSMYLNHLTWQQGLKQYESMA